MSNLTQTTINYLAAREAAEAAEKAKKQAEAAMKAAYAEAGITYNVVDGKKVSVNRKGRKSFDAAMLSEMVSKAIFRKVVKEAIDQRKFEAAVTTGQIKPEVAEAVTKVTEYDEVRVTDLAKEEGSVATSVAA